MINDNTILSINNIRKYINDEESGLIKFIVGYKFIKINDFFYVRDFNSYKLIPFTDIFIKLNDSIYVGEVNSYKLIPITDSKYDYIPIVGLLVKHWIKFQNKIMNISSYVNTCGFIKLILQYGTEDNKNRIILLNRNKLNDFICNKSNCNKICSYYKNYKFIHMLVKYSGNKCLLYAIKNGLDVKTLLPIP